MPKARYQGFTLIELSIVLVIIGLIVGGVLVGQSLIRAAAVRAQITQIEKYQTAVNTFRTKYNNYLPGDIPNPDAAMFGFSTPGTPGRGDGNGVLESWNGTVLCDYCEDAYGELAMFWTDLRAVNLIDGGFVPAGVFMPPALIGRGSLVYVTSLGSINYFGIAVITSANNFGGAILHPPAGFTVQEAYSIDNKIDDGLPQTGRVLAGGINNNIGITLDNYSSGSPSPTTCYDTTSGQYSLTQANGSGVNCHLSFQFQ